MSLWDPQQREWLEAMGHSLLVLADAGPVDALEDPAPTAAVAAPLAAPTVAPPAAATPARPVPARRESPTAADAPVVFDPPIPAAAPPPKTDRAAKAAALQAARAGAHRQPEGPLLQALLRATGQLPAAAARTLRELGIDASLRDDPAAKRALWVRLRALRRAGGQ